MTTQIVPPHAWWRPWAWIAAVVTAIMVATLGVFFVGRPLFTTDKSCGDGVFRAGPLDHCVGVTDGSVVFAPELQDIENRIRTENDRVTAAGEGYVSIVVLIPMTLRPNGEAVTLKWVQHHLEGAHLAQLAANHPTTGDPHPKIRLLLTNADSQLEQWERVIEQIEQRRTSDKIVAVTGIGISVGNAGNAIARLSKNHMPVVTSTLTSDDLGIGVVPGFLRVAPTNSAQARAAAAYIKPRAASALVVRDMNAADHYALTLVNEFTKAFVDETHRLVPHMEDYDSGLSNASITFGRMMSQICSVLPGVIYFAGRAIQAEAFVKELAQRTCTDTPMTVLTGDSFANNVPDAAFGTALATGVSVIYTGLAHPDAWQREPHAFNAIAAGLFGAASCPDQHCYRALSSDGLEDGFAIMAYDAVITAISAVRQVAGAGGQDVRAEDVLQSMNRLHDANAIMGASGKLSFDNAGIPTDKPVPMLQSMPGPVPAFLGLSWPDR